MLKLPERYFYGEVKNAVDMRDTFNVMNREGGINMRFAKSRECALFWQFVQDLVSLIRINSDKSQVRLECEEVAPSTARIQKSYSVEKQIVVEEDRPLSRSPQSQTSLTRHQRDTPSRQKRESVSPRQTVAETPKVFTKSPTRNSPGMNRS